MSLFIRNKNFNVYDNSNKNEIDIIKKQNKNVLTNQNYLIQTKTNEFYSVNNRFDFDWEILAKLVRSGYTPLEIPVNYVSRSFSEGKKIRLFRDPLTWVFALIKYRFIKLN